MSGEKGEDLLEILKKELQEAQELERECRETLRKKVAELEEENNFFRRQAIVDAPTGIYNRGYFNKEFEKEFSTVQRMKNGNFLSIVLIDVDCFKQFNDKYGHPEGDKVLRQIAHESSLVLQRKPDFVARYGGEEFVFVLPNTDQDGAKRLAEKARIRVERLGIPHEGNKGSDSKVVTISLGVATFTPEDSSPSDLLIRADRNLYKAKDLGRNRVYSQPSDKS